MNIVLLILINLKIMAINRQKEFIEKAKVIHNNIYEYSLVNYITSKTKVTVLCSIHGEFTVTPNDHLSKKSGCPACALNKRTGRLPIYSFEDRVNQLQNKFGDKYTYSYVSSKQIQVNCIKHGSSIKDIQDTLSAKTICYKCRKDEQELQYLQTKWSHFPIISKLDTYYVLSCSLHGIFKTTISNLKRSEFGCRKCSKTISTSEYLKVLQTIDKSKYIDFTSFVFNGYLNKSVFKCKIHDVTYSQTPKQYFINNGCYLCSYSSVSKTELEIREFITKLYSGLVLYNYRPSWLNGKELDIYIPDLNLAIEYNGTIYHHSSFNNKDQFFSKTAKLETYHYDKWEICFNNNVQLISIYDYKYKFKYEAYELLLTRLIFNVECVLDESKVIFNKLKVIPLDCFKLALYSIKNYSFVLEVYNQKELIAYIIVYRNYVRIIQTTINSYSNLYLIVYKYLQKLSSKDWYLLIDNDTEYFSKEFGFKIKLDYDFVHKNINSYFSYELTSSYLKVFNSGTSFYNFN